MGAVRLLLCVIPLFAVPQIAAADWFANVEAGLLHDDNLGNAELATDILNDTALVSSLSAGRVFQLGDSDGLIFEGRLKRQDFNRFHGLNNLAAGASLAWKHKWGLGAYAPWLRLTASADRLDYRDAARTGWLDAFGIRAGKRVAEQWDLDAELGFERRRADDAKPLVPGISGAVFDQGSKALAFNARYAASEALQFSLGYALRQGDVVSTTQARMRKAFLVSTAIAEDEALGADAYAYKLNSSSGTLHAGMAVALTPQCLLSLDYQRLVTHGDGGNNYVKSLTGIALSYNF